MPDLKKRFICILAALLLLVTPTGLQNTIHTLDTVRADTGTALTLNSASMILGENTGFRFYFSVPSGSDIEGFTVKIGKTEYRLSDITGQDTMVDSSAVTQYVIDYAMPANDINEDLTVKACDAAGTLLTIIDSEGTECSEITINTASYAAKVAEEEDAVADALIDAIIDYGKNAKAYFEAGSAPGSASAEDFVDFQMKEAGSLATSVTYCGSSLVLKDTTALRHYFRISDTLANHTFQVDGETVTPVQKGSLYYIEISGIHAEDLDRSYTLQVDSYTLSYSVFSYCYQVLSRADSTSPNTSDDPSGSMAGLFDSMLTFRNCAEAYIAKKEDADKTLKALHVEGTQLVDPEGNPVQLKGISTHGIAWFPEYVNQDLFTELSETWDVDVIRLAMYTAENGGYCTGGDQDQLKQLVKNGVEYATNAGMYAIIDWHVLNDQNPNTYQSQAIAFFDEMSATYASYDNVIYEICNEPNSGVTWAEIKSYALNVIPVIKTNDPDAVIIVGTPTWSQDVDVAAEDPITGYTNIMYALHFYAATHMDDLRSKLVTAVNKGLPIFVSEYGICDASGNGSINTEQANLWMALLNSYQISSCAWNLSNKAETSSIISSSCSKTSGFGGNDLSDSGKWLYSMLTGSLELPEAEITGNTGESSSGSTGSENTSESKPSAADSPISTDGYTCGSVKVTFSISNSWYSDDRAFYQYDVTVQNISGSDIASWSAEIKADSSIALNTVWCASANVSGQTLTLTPETYNASIAAGSSVSGIGMIVERL